MFDCGTLPFTLCMTQSSDKPSSKAKTIDAPLAELHGFLLTRHWQDVRPTGSFARSVQYKGNLQLTYWLATDNGPIKIVVDGQQSILFVEQKQKERVEGCLQALFSSALNSWQLADLELKNFDDEPMLGVYFNAQRDLYIARDKLRECGVDAYEADIQPADRFLMERFLTGGIHCTGRVLPNAFTMHNPKLAVSDYTPTLKVVSLDIETSMDGKTLYCIGVSLHRHLPSAVAESMRSQVEQKVVFMLQHTNTNVEQLRAENIHCYRTETELLRAFLLWFSEVDPDVVIGWNVINFDFKFLQKVADRCNIALAMGRERSTLDWRASRVNEDFLLLIVPGRVVLDGIDTLKSATYNFESFALDFVAKSLLDRGKLIDDVDNRGVEITTLFRTDQLALARYNLEDCLLVWEIFCHTRLVHFAIERARLTGLPMDRHGGSVAAFDFRYLPLLHRKGRIAPILQEDPAGVGSPGGYVMDSKPGLYQYVYVLDFKSLYPSIIRTFHIDPLARVEGQSLVGEHKLLRTEAEAVFPAETEVGDIELAVPGFNGAAFAKRSAILPNIIGQLWRERDKAKQQKNLAMSQAVKILMNSFYGVLGTPGCRFFDYRLPSSITLRGHCILKQTKKLIEEAGHEVIYGDTDSVFVWMKDVTDEDSAKSVKDRGHYLARQLNMWWKDFLFQHYDIPSFLELEFETCYQRFVMPTIRGSDLGSKKRYAGLTFAAEEGAESSLVFKGLEAVRTDWTQLAREFQRELYRRVFAEENIEEYIREQIQCIHAGELDHKLVYRKRIRRNLAEYVKNVPPHVQAARKADDFRLQQGKPPRYARGGWVRYVLTTSGPEPMECVRSPMDYDQYVERQIKPIVEGIARFLGSSYEQLASRQMGLF